MYTNYGDAYVARVISSEAVSPKRESISLHFPSVWMNTLRSRVNRFIETIQAPQVACDKNPQFC